MVFQRYENTDSFADDTLEILLENEEQNNLPISFISNKTDEVRKWLLATVKDEHGSVVLTAACTPPFNLILYETRNQQDDRAVELLSAELKNIGFSAPGVLAEQSLAARFARTHVGKAHERKSLNIMRLDRVSEYKSAPGRLRAIREEDLFFLPYWARAFGEECHVEVPDIVAAAERLRKNVGRDTNYIWEDGFPMSQAVHGRSTPNGAVVSYVYTPPHYRGRGCASSCVAALSQCLLDRGFKFCALFADVDNPVSNGIYRKIGYRDVCVYDELKLD